MDRALLDRRLHFLSRRVAQAQRQFALLDDGDRVAIAVSGGKDSSALALALPVWRRTAGLDLELLAVRVRLPEAAAPAAPGDRLADVCRLAGLPLHETAAPPAASAPPGARDLHPCFRCARRRRHALVRWAAEHDCAKVALGHHLDDAAETALLNLLFRGRLESLAPRRTYLGGAVTVVRPLILAQERELARVAACLGPAAPPCACPTTDGRPPPSARGEVRSFLRSLGRRSAAAQRHLWRASLAGLPPDPPELTRENA